MNEWWKGIGATEIIQALPWISPEAIKYLETIVWKGAEVIEHGSGGSTLWFASRCQLVTAYEHDPDWYERLTRQGLPDNASVVMWTRKNLPKLKPDCCDILMIDGEPVEHRAAWIKAAPKMVRNGGWIVLDNANRPEYAKEREWLQDRGFEFCTIDGNTGITKTMITDFYLVQK